jgi:release factor glutamine methyltransferase
VTVPGGKVTSDGTVTVLDGRVTASDGTVTVLGGKVATLGNYLNAQRHLDRIDADVLAAHVLEVERAYLYSHPERILDSAELARIDALVAQRAAGTPLAYLTGHKEFWSLTLEVDASVLIPRPETELLVEVALTRLADGARILDLGTGSGAIALALAVERDDCSIIATEHDPNALAVARRNAARHGCNVRFLQCDWFGDLDEPFDVILSNPPYIAAADPHLDALNCEPRKALIGGADGLDDLRIIIGAAPDHLTRNGWLLVEHGWDQAQRVRTLFRDAGFAGLETHRDAAGLERVTAGQLP